MGILKKIKDYSREQIATAIAIAFHLSGVIAIAGFHSSFFIGLTPLNLLVCAGLLFYTQRAISWGFLLFCFLAFITGFGSEWIGVNTGVLFGSYKYGIVLGPKWQGVPLMIGIQWLVTMFCSGSIMHLIEAWLKSKAPVTYQRFPRWWFIFSIIGDGAVMAVIFDWVIEPVAVKLEYWQWQDGIIPMSNYYSWWAITFIIQAAFYFLPFRKTNIFALNLLLIQLMFFLLLRTFLP